MEDLKKRENSWPRIIGAGPGSPQYFTLNLINSLARANKVFAAERILNVIRPYTKAELIKLEEDKQFYSMIKNIREEEGTYVLSTGDPMIAGLGPFFVNSLIEPGISSVQKCASLIHEPLTNSVILSTRYGKNYEKIKPVLELGLRVYLLPEPQLNIATIMRKLATLIKPTSNVAICMNLTLHDQRTYSGTINEFTELKDNGLKIIFIRPPSL
ncbi:MAG: cobalt-precorrin-7 (C(5))-methyltransferase [Metallosphaera sp.]